MKTRFTFLLSGIGALALGTVAASSSGGPPPAATASAAPAAAPASMPAAAPASAPVARKRMSWVPPSTTSDRPSEADWSNAEPLDLARPHARCTAKHLREWVRVQCAHSESAREPFMGVRVVGGSHEGVWVVDTQDGKKGERDIAVVFPVRIGDRRMIELAGTQPLMWKSWTVFEYLDVAISELWLASEPAPTIVVH